ncbi:suppressor of fused domain protein, partial [Acetobacter indonesiensis]
SNRQKPEITRQAHQSTVLRSLQVFLWSVQVVIEVGVTMIQDLRNSLPFIFEKEFGQIQGSMKSSVEDGLQIVEYKNEHLNFISTLGLSKNYSILSMEWFMEFQKELPNDNAASMMDYYISLLLSNHIACPKRGNFILFSQPEDHIWVKDNICGIYFTVPAYRSDLFQEEMKKIKIIPIWVVPIANIDKEILENKGWKYLECFWEDNQIDLHDPFRRY